MYVRKKELFTGADDLTATLWLGWWAGNDEYDKIIDEKIKKDEKKGDREK